MWIVEGSNLSYLVRLHPDFAEPVNGRDKSSSASLTGLTEWKLTSSRLKPGEILSHSGLLDSDGSRLDCTWWSIYNGHGDFAVESVCNKQAKSACVCWRRDEILKISVLLKFQTVLVILVHSVDLERCPTTIGLPRRQVSFRMLKTSIGDN